MKDGLFGEGYQSERYNPEEDLKVIEKLQEQAENHIMPPVNASAGEDDTALYANMLLKCTRQMAGMMVEVVRLIQEAPAELLKHTHFKNIVSATQQLLGSAPIAFDMPEYDDVWCTVTTMNEIDDAVKKRNELMKMHVSGYPSFSVGSTKRDKGNDFDVSTSETDDAFKKKNELMKMHVSEYPSFSIGLTQMDQGQDFDGNESHGVVQPCDENNESHTIINEVEVPYF